MDSVSQDKINKLRQVLGALPQSLVENLILTAETVDPVLARLITVSSVDPDELARARFFSPLAPLSGDPTTTRPSMAFAPPRTLESLWDWISTTLDPDSADEARQLAVSLTETEPGELDPVRVHVAERILKALESVMDDDKRAKALRLSLGIPDFRAVHDIAIILKTSSILREALTDLPEVMSDIDDEMSATIRDRYEMACEEDADAGMWFLYFVMARLSKPWRILRTFKRIAHRGDDFLVSRTDMSGIGDALLQDAEHHLTGFSTPPMTLKDAETAASALEDFAAITVGMTREIGIRKDGTWGQKLLALRNKASSQMESIHARARRVFKPVLAKPLHGRAARLDPPPMRGSARYDEALAMCRFLYLTKDDASRAAAGGAHKQLMSETQVSFENLGAMLLEQVRSGIQDAEPTPEQRLEDVAEFLTALGAEQEASLLLRRVAAAQAA